MTEFGLKLKEALKSSNMAFSPCIVDLLERELDAESAKMSMSELTRRYTLPTIGELNLIKHLLTTVWVKTQDWVKSEKLKLADVVSSIGFSTDICPIFFEKGLLTCIGERRHAEVKWAVEKVSDDMAFDMYRIIVKMKDSKRRIILTDNERQIIKDLQAKGFPVKSIAGKIFETRKNNATFKIVEVAVDGFIKRNKIQNAPVIDRRPAVQDTPLNDVKLSDIEKMRLLLKEKSKLIEVQQRYIETLENIIL